MNMNCFVNHCRREQQGIALLIAGVTSAKERERAERHLANCAACRAYYQELQTVLEDLARLKRQAVPVVPAQLRAQWQEEISDNARETGRPSL